MGVIKVSNSKSNLQGHYSRAMAMVPFDRPHTISRQSSIATMSLSYTVYEILSLISQNLKRPHDSEHIPFWGYYITHALVLLCINQYTKFELPSFTNYRDMDWGQI